MFNLFRKNVHYEDNAVNYPDLIGWEMPSYIFAISIFGILMAIEAQVPQKLYIYYIPIYFIGFIITFILTSFFKPKKEIIRTQLILLSLGWYGLFIILFIVEIWSTLVFLTKKLGNLHETISSISKKKNPDIKSEITPNGAYRTVAMCPDCQRPL